MAYPVVELITQNVFMTLEAVRIASGWSVDLDVERELKFGNRLRDKLAVIKQQDATRIDQENIPQERIGYRQQYWVECYVVEPEESDTPIDQRINQVRADVEKAIMVDPFRDGNALDTIIRDPIPIIDDQGRWEGIIVVFDVMYRTLHSDPYTRG